MDNIINLYPDFKDQNLKGRYITAEDLFPQLERLKSFFEIKEIGRSVLNLPIHEVSIGSGPIKILAWSQMHGNETTTTKAVFDLFNFLKNSNEIIVQNILESCQIKIIPMLNPDGAALYTRENVNSVDLNRDARNLQQVESRVLRNLFEDFTPHFCLNLHDQRTIFSAGNTDNPAVLSFLAPALDEERSINETRMQSMQLIASINEVLQEYIPEKIGKYDDAFNPNCTGDSFQKSVPTILFEAGHFPGDYQRETTRKYMFIAILSAIIKIANNEFKNYGITAYAKIPENHKNFFDVILRKAKIQEEVVDIGIQFEEKLKDGKLYFDPIVKIIEANLPQYGHQEINCGCEKVAKNGEGDISENDLVAEILLKGNKLSIKTE